MIFINRTFLRSTWQDMKQQRGRYPWLFVMALILLLAFELVPRNLMPWPRWLLLISALSWVICSIDFNMMLWRLHKKRSDLQPVRLTLLLLGIIVSLLALGRVLGLASLFYGAVLGLASLVNLASGALALVLVLMARSVEDYAVSLPALADLHTAHSELHEARKQLDLREQLAVEGMLVMADDTIIEANEEAYRILGYEQASHELIGLRVHQIVHEDDSPKAHASLRQKSTPKYLLRLLCKDKSIKHVEASGVLMQRSDIEVRVSSFRDVSLQLRCLQVLDRSGLGNDELIDKQVSHLDELRRYFHLDPAAKPATTHAK